MKFFNNKYPYTDLHELNADFLLEQTQSNTEHLKEYDEKINKVFSIIEENNKKERSQIDSSYLGRVLLQLRRKVLSMTGTLRVLSNQVKDVNLRIGTVGTDRVEMAVNGASLRLYINYSDRVLNGLITRLRGYPFSTNDLYKPFHSSDDGYYTHIYVNGKRVITDSSTALSDVFHKGDYVESITVVAHINSQYNEFRVIQIDKTGIHIYRTWGITSAAPYIHYFNQTQQREIWIDSVRTDKIQHTTNSDLVDGVVTLGGSLLLRNDLESDFSATHIYY